MLDFKGKVLGIARENPRRLVLPEGQDIRVMRAAEMCIKEKIVSDLFLLGDPDELSKKARDEGISLSGMYLRDPKKSEKLEKYSNIFYESRKHKGMTEEEAHKTLSDEVYYGAMMLKQGEVDAMVSGSLSPTAKTVRASILIVQPKEGVKTVSSCFVMIVPNTIYGYNGAFIYADCGVVPEPTSEQLVDIAVSSAESAHKLLGIDPVVPEKGAEGLDPLPQAVPGHPVVINIAAAEMALQRRGKGLPEVGLDEDDDRLRPRQDRAGVGTGDQVEARPDRPFVLLPPLFEEFPLG